MNCHSVLANSLRVSRGAHTAAGRGPHLASNRFLGGHRICSAPRSINMQILLSPPLTVLECSAHHLPFPFSHETKKNAINFRGFFVGIFCEFGCRCATWPCTSRINMATIRFSRPCGHSAESRDSAGRRTLDLLRPWLAAATFAASQRALLQQWADILEVSPTLPHDNHKKYDRTRNKKNQPTGARVKGHQPVFLFRRMILRARAWQGRVVGGGHLF